MTSTGSLSRIECRTCAEVTLHVNGVCNHCKTPRAQYVPPDFKRWNGNPKTGSKR